MQLTSMGPSLVFTFRVLGVVHEDVTKVGIPAVIPAPTLRPGHLWYW